MFNLYSSVRALADVYKDSQGISLCQAMDVIAKELNLGNHNVLKEKLSSLSYEDLYSEGMDYLGRIPSEIFYPQLSLDKAVIYPKYASEYAFLKWGYPPVDHVILNTQEIDPSQRDFNHSLYCYPYFNEIHIRREHLMKVYLDEEPTPYHVIKSITISNIHPLVKDDHPEEFDAYYEKLIGMLRYIVQLDKDRLILIRDCFDENFINYLLSKDGFKSLNGNEGIVFNHGVAKKAEQLTV